MQNRRNKKRRLSIQNLENRKLFAADIGGSDMHFVPEMPAEVGTLRSGALLTDEVEANTSPEPTEVNRPEINILAAWFFC